MKRLIVCIDGTGNAPELGPGEPAPTNVLRFLRALKMRDASRQPQIACYLSGVATDTAYGSLTRTKAGATGSGLSQLVHEAYLFLTSNYERGDKIYLLGFSRGAAAARSLSGLTEIFGILPKAAMHLFPQAWRYYNTPPPQRWLDGLRDANLKKIAEYGNQVRERHLVECAARPSAAPVPPHAHAVTSDQRSDETDPRAGRADDEYVALPLHFVGVWDTVVRAPRQGHHESRIASNVEAAYHALAVHEVRSLFAPDQWKVKCPHQVARQTWFPGAHADVGGGTGDIALPSWPFRWMADMARRHGLDFDADYLARADVFRPDSRAPVSVSRHYNLFYGLFPPRTRVLTRVDDDAGSTRVPSFRHISVDARLRRFECYEPPYHRDGKAFAVADDASVGLPLEPAMLCAEALWAAALHASDIACLVVEGSKADASYDVMTRALADAEAAASKMHAAIDRAWGCLACDRSSGGPDDALHADLVEHTMRLVERPASLQTLKEAMIQRRSSTLLQNLKTSSKPAIKIKNA